MSLIHPQDKPTRHADKPAESLQAKRTVDLSVHYLIGEIFLQCNAIKV
jgi:hypothetical protein